MVQPATVLSAAWYC
jgi:TetR/AcrR family transcriptional regulator, transcriptional repressor for nem operon